jgi:hypothetical protein
MKQVTDLSAIEKVIDGIISANPDKVAQAKAKPAAVQWFVGQAMKATGGKADPKAVNELLKAKLGLDGNERPAKVAKGRQEVLFEDRKRTRQEPLQRGERLVDFYDECGRNGYDEFRSLVNLWLSELPTADRAKLISTMRNAGNNAFGAALCELVVHALLKRLKCEVVLHPTMPRTDTQPDFEATDSAGERFYVEVTTVNRADETVDTLKREAPLYNAINQAKLPPGCMLGYKLVKATSDDPDLEGLVSSVERWAQQKASVATNAPIIGQFAAGDWTVELELFAGGDVDSGTSAIGIAWHGGGAITPPKDIRGRLEGKSEKYGTIDVPYLIVVADAKDQMFSARHVRDAITEAALGDEQTTFVGRGIPRPNSAPNGFWWGPGPKNRHVTAILLLPETGIWKLRDPNWEPILAVNPWATAQLPSSLNSLTRLEADQAHWVERKGTPIGDLLELPKPWPPQE